jgi:c-di-GMP-binding flagellar brake protein YcgR
MDLSHHEAVEFLEKRKCARREFKLWVHYKVIHNGKISDKLESLTQDLSAGGVGLKADHELQPGQMMMITLYLPPENKRFSLEETLITDEANCLPISILSRIAWCKEEQEKEFRFGAQFIELDEISRELLGKYFEHYQLQTKGSLIFN